MIEIVFGDSAGGSLKGALLYGKGTCIGCGNHIFGSHPDGSELTQEEIKVLEREAEERDRLAWEKAKPIDGNPADVYAFTLVLSVGDISEDIPDKKRQQVLNWLWRIYPDVDGEDINIGDELIQKVKPALKEILNRAAAGEALRIWYSNQPDELCGMYWFMTQLAQLETYGDIYLVKLPEWESDEHGNIEMKTGWGELASWEWHRYFELQKAVPPAFCQHCANRWRALQKENAPLRTMLNGQLVSAPETLYDTFITREIAAEGQEFHEAQVIGCVLGKYTLGIGDAWVALRIEEMIRSGLLEPVTEAAKDAPIYHRYLKKCSEFK